MYAEEHAHAPPHVLHRDADAASVPRNYPHIAPVAVEDLRLEEREALVQIAGPRHRLPQRRGHTRRYGAVFDETGLPLPSATGGTIGGTHDSMFAADGAGAATDKEPDVLGHTAPSKPIGIRAIRRKLSSTARAVFTCGRE